MNGRYLLDTAIVIALFANDTTVSQQLSEAAEVLIPSVVLGELYYGARKSSQIDRNIDRLDEFAARSTIVNCDSPWRAAMAWSRIDFEKRAAPFPKMTFGSRLLLFPTN